MGEHTKGPWYVFDGRERINPTIEVRGKNDEVVVFWAGFDRSEMSPRKRRANAKLIASAPALAAEVERLREALQEIIDGDSGGTFSGSQCCEIAQTALARQGAGNG